MNKFMEQANLIKDDIVEFRRTIHTDAGVEQINVLETIVHQSDKTHQT